MKQLNGAVDAVAYEQYATHDPRLALQQTEDDKEWDDENLHFYHVFGLHIRNQLITKVYNFGK